MPTDRINLISMLHFKKSHPSHHLLHEIPKKVGRKEITFISRVCFYIGHTVPPDLAAMKGLNFLDKVLNLFFSV